MRTVRGADRTGNELVYETPELAYLVEVERFNAKVGGRDERAHVAIRVTSVFRLEDGMWDGRASARRSDND